MIRRSTRPLTNSERTELESSVLFDETIRARRAARLKALVVCCTVAALAIWYLGKLIRPQIIGGRGIFLLFFLVLLAPLVVIGPYVFSKSRTKARQPRDLSDAMAEAIEIDALRGWTFDSGDEERWEPILLQTSPRRFVWIDIPELDGLWIDVGSVTLHDKVLVVRFEKYTLARTQGTMVPLHQVDASKWFSEVSGLIPEVELELSDLPQRLQDLVRPPQAPPAPAPSIPH